MTNPALPRLQEEDLEDEQWTSLDEARARDEQARRFPPPKGEGE